MEIHVKDLLPGMIFPTPVFFNGNNLLVPEGVAISKKDIDQLIALGCTVVSTEGIPVEPSPGEQEAPPFVPQAPIQETQPVFSTKVPDSEETPTAANNAHNALSLSDVQENTGAYRNYIALIDKLDVLFSHVTSGVPVQHSVIDDLTGRLLQTIRDERSQIIGFILGGEVSGRQHAKSSVNTAILSALTAMELNLSHSKVMPIVTGALLHDVGMLRLPPEIINKSGSLSKKEEQQIHAHPLFAYQFITGELLYAEEVGLTAMQHHERWDGEGYPRRISGEGIDIGARIVSVADAFEAMVSEKPYRNSMMGYQAMKNLLSDNSRRFDPDVLKAFFSTMGIYPIGSMIMLNNGAVARVTDIEKDAPLRPKVRILIDESGVLHKNDEGSLINLLSEKNLFIARALNPKEIAVKSG
jgi:HD-GYP domain-containing protein (c-di-GMP phosphodiesterase class II)